MKKLIFLLANKHEIMLQVDTMVLMGMVKHSQVPKSKYVMSLQYLKNKVRDEVDFLHAINIKFPVI